MSAFEKFLLSLMILCATGALDARIQGFIPAIHFWLIAFVILTLGFALYNGGCNE